MPLAPLLTNQMQISPFIDVQFGINLQLVYGLIMHTYMIRKLSEPLLEDEDSYFAEVYVCCNTLIKSMPASTST